MRRAVAFAGTIKDSRRVEALFAETVAQYAAAHDPDDDACDPMLTCRTQHVDGTTLSVSSPWCRAGARRYPRREP